MLQGTSRLVRKNSEGRVSTGKLSQAFWIYIHFIWSFYPSTTVSFYDSSGHIDVSSPSHFLRLPPSLRLLDWSSARRRSSLSPSLREFSVSQSLSSRSDLSGIQDDSSSAFAPSIFLLTEKDGVALPEGPVVISPDGLFPSLFREVIRRAPHEFKIACLEDIKALFPLDQNPFYAGFGNRDTDELSYVKVGIPKGKVFIINPKGEVALASPRRYKIIHFAP